MIYNDTTILIVGLSINKKYMIGIASVLFQLSSDIQYIFIW